MSNIAGAAAASPNAPTASTGPNATGMPASANPLISSIISLMPPIGENWDWHDRRAWIHLVWDAVENLYGSTTPIAVTPAPTPPAPSSTPAASNGSSTPAATNGSTASTDTSGASTTTSS